MLRYISHPLAALIITLGVLVFYISLIKTERTITTSTALVDVLQAEVKQKQVTTAQLENTLRQATSSAYQEKIVRDQLLMQKPGEYVLQIPPQEEKVVQREVQLRASPQEQWQKLLFPASRQ